MHTFITVVGARPQFIKAAVVSREVARRDDVREVLVHTGQHYNDNMSQVFFDELGIPAPAYSLEVGSGTHGAQTGRMLAEVERVLLEVRPGLVLVYGDTNSTLAGALAAAKLGIPIAHVEAGLRSFNRAMPEEINRVMTDHLADVLFTPTEAAVANLAREGIGDERIRRVGDVMYDATLFATARAGAMGVVPNRLGLEPGNYALATVHRAENTDDAERLRCILEGLASVARHVPVALPLHPRTRGAIAALGLEPLVAATPGLHLIEPVGYFEMQALVHGARAVVTDSGGVQKEAYFHRVPCITVRDETEWVELVHAGWNVLVPPTSGERISSAVLAAMSSPKPPVLDLYGDGHAGRAIVEALAQLLAERSASHAALSPVTV